VVEGLGGALRGCAVAEAHRLKPVRLGGGDEVGGEAGGAGGGAEAECEPLVGLAVVGDGDGEVVAGERVSRPVAHGLEREGAENAAGLAGAKGGGFFGGERTQLARPLAYQFRGNAAG
jgi:hypothetical protein